MRPPASSGRRVTAILQALLVAFLWATSWVLIKDGLREISPLVFAGLRYFLAFVLLSGVFVVGARRTPPAPLPRAMWLRLVVLGLFLYTGAQGALFVALKYLPAVTVNLLLSFSNLAVALMGSAMLAEIPTWLQWIGVALSGAGGFLYFGPAAIPSGGVPGLIAALAALASNSISTILGREVNRTREHSPLVVTLVSMGAGSGALLLTGLVVEGVPSIGLRGWVTILWLAAVNTAFAFTLWNHTLRTLTAVESSVINSTMLLWIPILAVLVLGETLTVQQILGMVAVGAGAVLVQLRGRTEAGGRP